MAERVEAWSAIIAELTAYEGKAYKRKPLLLGKRGHADDAVEKCDTEGESLEPLEQEAASLLVVFEGSTGVIDRRLNALTAKRKTSNSKTTSKLSVTEVAERMRVSRNKVLKWIDDKELPATNVANTGSQRKRWRIDPKDWEAFEMARQPVNPPPSSTRKRRKRSDVTEYFRGLRTRLAADDASLCSPADLYRTGFAIR